MKLIVLLLLNLFILSNGSDVARSRSTHRSSHDDTVTPYTEYDHKRPRLTSDWALDDEQEKSRINRKTSRSLILEENDPSLLDEEDNSDFLSNLSFSTGIAQPSLQQIDRARKSKDKTALYDAYNQLHSLAQAYDKPFDAPAVVVVGHQSSGKSALIEALMGYQFSEVGGGTKTRRPVALRMQYNPLCSEPRWFLVGEDGIERPMTLVDVQDYIERENKRLERDPMRSFDPREINIRMEYKHCPNLILIDTPGLISAPKVPKNKKQTSSSSAVSQQRALQAAAREAERLVIEKMRCEDYIILCVEDTNDWKHGVTREIVQKADPELSRTVVVNTKFDTKMPQFSSPTDVEEFVRASVLDKVCPHKLGGPFFTSVPSGRVGRSEERGIVDDDYLFETDEQFVKACADAESSDYALVKQRLKKLEKTKTKGTSKMLSRIGLRKLRSFLEERVDECYRRNVRKIIPMLQSEYIAAEKRLKACEKELESLSVDRLKAGADAFCDEFCACLRKAIQGTIVAPVALFGETLQQETATAGSFHDVNGSPMAVSDRTWDRLVETEVGNRDHRLYGGSQYHRTLREFHLATRCLRTPVISEDEIANAAGIGDAHDGVNFLHSACVIALEKAHVSFEPMLTALQLRMTHVMDRLCPVTEYMVREKRDRSNVRSTRYASKEHRDNKDNTSSLGNVMDVSQNPQFRQLVQSIFEDFVRRCLDSTMARCRDDLTALTRFVTWSLDEGGSSALSRALPDQTDIISVYQVVLNASTDEADSTNKAMSSEPGNNSKGTSTIENQNLVPQQRSVPDLPVSRGNSDKSYRGLIEIMDEALMTRDGSRTNVVISGLVQHIIANWREQFCKNVTTKFNCYFMLPFVDDFHRFIRNELQNLCDEGENAMTDVFDLTAVRRSLESNRRQLKNECEANKRLQEKFQLCASLVDC